MGAFLTTIYIVEHIRSTLYRALLILKNRHFLWIHQLKFKNKIIDIEKKIIVFIYNDYTVPDGMVQFHNYKLVDDFHNTGQFDGFSNDLILYV